MKRIIILAAALSLMVPAMSLAAPNNPPDKNHGVGTTKPATGAKPVGAKPGGHHPHKPGGGKPNKPGPKPPHKPGKPNKPGLRPPHKPGWKPGRPGHRPPGRPGYHKPRPNQYYWRGKWLNRIRLSVFSYPRGYHYRVWYEGDRLPPVFLAPTYYYDGYAQLGLETPPPGYRWVRYGPDLLLVDIHTYAIEQVVYGAFY